MASKTVTELVELTEKVVDSSFNPDLHKKWLDSIRGTGTESLVELTSLLTSEENKRAANIKSMREAVISEIERKNTENMILTMEKLDAAACKLSILSLVLALVGAVLAAIPVLQAFGYLRPRG